MLIFFVDVVIALENDQPGISRIIGTGVYSLCFGAVFVILFRVFYLFLPACSLGNSVAAKHARADR
jgi:hypothetical protein